MVTRDQRLSEFNGAGEPPENKPMELLCEDKSGTYRLPFLCVWRGGLWQNPQTDMTIEATVVGWRQPLNGPA